MLDFNGTISDDEPLLEEIYRELFAGIGLELSGARYHAEFAGLSDPAIIAGGIALAGRSGEPGLAARLEVEHTARYLERVRARSPITPAAAGFVRAAAARVPVAIASGAARETIEAALAGTGLRPLFSAIVSSEDVTHGKPDPEGYLRALAAARRRACARCALRGRPRLGRRGRDRRRARRARRRHARRRAAHGGLRRRASRPPT